MSEDYRPLVAVPALDKLRDLKALMVAVTQCDDVAGLRMLQDMSAAESVSLNNELNLLPYSLFRIVSRMQTLLDVSRGTA